ncbi:DEAD/DEAH box helicase family protein [Geomonas subterranea]|uniref:DEAD/DEAH box helicase family protein n=1 Tax=Geomonas subterranea TaxID=2847989 RepID=UPI001CD2C840|nr:DEAD/DEAH box helicase family protein [Geomonas fuzhouensis]
MQITQDINNHFRTKGNEVAKGYFPTLLADVEMVKHVVSAHFGWDQRSATEKALSVFDPCAGEGAFLSGMVRHFRRDAKSSDVKNARVLSYAVELDKDRFEKVRGTEQKINSSFFDTTIAGSFDVVLLNPPYNRNGKELQNWVEKAAPMVHHQGAMVLIIPKAELKKPMIDFLRGSFSYRYAYLSEDYAKFKQVVVFLSNSRSNDGQYRFGAARFYDNLNDTAQDPIGSFDLNNHAVLEVRASRGARPLLSSKDLSGVYADCETLLEKASRVMLDKEYPSNFDTSILPASTLRTAHAVQLAAMNSQIECVELNGETYLAKYMLVNEPESFEDVDEDTGKKTVTTIHKPTVETFLMDKSGVVKKAKDYGFDYFELNSHLSTILLQKLTKMYIPLHEIGKDETFLAGELAEIGLKAPQREAVRSVIKAYKSGRKGIGIRANTGTGKTWMAKAVKYILGAKRSIMVTEPQLVPQMVKEYESEGFDVHVIDSWERLQELAVTRPKGLYLLAYTRLRMHPNYVPVYVEKKVKTSEGLKFANACTSCGAEAGKIKKGEKNFCSCCGAPLFTYLPENKRLPMSYKRWIADVERNGKSTLVGSHNKQLPYIKILKKFKFDLAIFDEAHNAANLMSNQGAAFIRLAATANHVLCLTATVTNGMAKSLYNLLWGINPTQMREAGWDHKSSTEFQTKLGAFKEVRKTDENNRHRDSEKVTTYDTAGISPAALVYTLPNFINVDSEDFDDLPPVEREVIKCASHPEVDECMKEIDNIISDAELPQEDKLPVASVRNAAFLRVSDTFKHASDDLVLRDFKLGTLKQRFIPELLEKEERLVELVQDAVDRGERVLVMTGNTQHIDMRGPLKRIIADNVPGVTIDVLPDSVPSDKLLKWFAQAKAQVAVVSFHRVATGLNLSHYNNLIWYDYTSNTRLAEQGEGRIRRVNTADIHRALFGEVRPVRYTYLTSSPIQEAQLAYTLEKRMISKLAEGETPDIDPAECTSGSQSFSAMITKALKEGSFQYNDPSILLKKMTKTENAGVRKENFAPAALASTAKVLPFKAPETAPAATPTPAPSPVSTEARTVIYVVGGVDQQVAISLDRYTELMDAGQLEFTLFGVYVREKALKRKSA